MFTSPFLSRPSTVFSPLSPRTESVLSQISTGRPETIFSAPTYHIPDSYLPSYDKHSIDAREDWKNKSLFER